MTSDHRRAPRADGYAKIVFLDSGTPAYIRNLSRVGLKVETLLHFDQVPGNRQWVEVVPEIDLGLPRFKLEVELRWILPTGIFTALGLEIREVPRESEKGLEALLEYYSE